MAAAAAGIWAHATHAAKGATVAQTAAPKAMPMDSTSGASGDSGGDSAVISANDFLTLLVTEMQNQDPTADNDPNEYINQLVNVNSLEQLISINQTLTGALGSGATGTSNPSGSAQPASGAQAVTTNAAQVPAPATSAQTHSRGGNLGVPSANPAAQRVAHALTEKQPSRSLGMREAH